MSGARGLDPVFYERNKDAFTREELQGLRSRAELVIRSKNPSAKGVAWCYMQLHQMLDALDAIVARDGDLDDSKAWDFMKRSPDG